MSTLLFDTETSGLVKNKLVPLDNQPQIVEYYGLSLEDEGMLLGEEGREVNHLEIGNQQFLINPGKPLSAEITRITGIDDKMVKDAPSFVDVAELIKANIEAHDAVVAHNLSFDRDMIDIEMKRCGLTVNWPRLICTVESTIHMKGHRLSLTALHEHLFGEPFTGAHRAETDVRALARCYLELKKRSVV